MATHDFNIFGAIMGFDTSGDCYPSTLADELTLANSKDQDCVVMEFPTGADIGFSVGFPIPQNYAGTPVLVIGGILDGTPASILAFGTTLLELADSSTIDAAYEAEDTASNSTWTGYADEDYYEETITLTPASAFTAGRFLLLDIYRDDSVDTTTFNFLLTTLRFRYSDT